MVVDLTTLDDRRPLVEEADERADQPGLALAAFAEQHDVVAGEQCAFELGEHGLVEADDAGEAFAVVTEPSEQVVTQLSLDGLVHMAGGAQRAKRRLFGSLLRSCHQARHATPVWWVERLGAGGGDWCRRCDGSLR